MNFGERLRTARKIAKLNQEELGEKIGVTKSSVSNYEKCITNPSIEVVYKICEVLGVDANYLFQDSIVRQNSLFDTFSKDTLEVILAYENSDLSVKNGVRRFLGLDNITTFLELTIEQQQRITEKINIYRASLILEEKEIENSI